MCLISGPVQAVKNTKILSNKMPLDGKYKYRVLTVYSNEVETTVKNNLMVLPIPSSADTIRLLDLTKYKTVFDDAKLSFSVLRSRGISQNFSMSVTPQYIAVQKVGGYDVSICSNINEFSNLNPNYFVVNKEIVDSLIANYKNYSFIVCKLNDQIKEYSPFGYTYDTNNEYVFVPTRHHHPHDKKANIYSMLNQHYSTSLIDDDSTGDYDHEIYFANAKTIKHPFKSSECKIEKAHDLCHIKWQKIDESFDTNIKNFYKLTIDGQYANGDIWIY